jgi:small conductance mechanosensitive channel
MIEDKFIKLYHRGIEFSFNYMPKLIIALVVLIVGWWLTKRIVKLIKQSITRKGFDPTVISFSSSLISISLKIVLLITVAGMIGVNTGSLLAILGAAGLAVGLALQNSLSNLASGFMILTFKPFKIGDIIESGNISGEVKSIQFFSTTLQTSDNKTVIIPNNSLSNGTIINLSKIGSIRVEIAFSVHFENDIQKITDIVAKVTAEENRILKNPASACVVDDFGNSEIKFKLFFFTSIEDRRHVAYDIKVRLVEELKKNKISQSDKN